MKILVTGARGMLGQDLCRLAAERGHEVCPTDVARLESDPEHRMDVTDRSVVQANIDRHQPDFVFHLAALTDVDGCERNPEAAYGVNTVGTATLAKICRAHGLPLLYVSTGSVFDGTKPTPYHEFDDPGPGSVYSRSKWAGEEAVRQQLVDHCIVRAGWMFGGGPEDKKFVAKMIELARSRPELRAVDDKFGSPCYTVDFARRCLELAEVRAWGTFHAPNTGWCSRYEMARAIVDFAGVTTCEVRPCSSAEFPLPAPRPRLEALENLHCHLLGMPDQPDWRDSLQRYVQGLIG